MSLHQRHTCGGPVFGRKAPSGECPRCDELRSGAEPIKWRTGAIQDATIRSIRAHDCKVSGCGPICTFGDW